MRISDWSSDVCSSDLMAIVLTPILMESQPPATVTPAENEAALVRFLEQLDTLQESPKVPREIARSARNLLESLEPFRNRPENLAGLDKGLQIGRAHV